MSYDYESPIRMVVDNFTLEIEEGVVKACQKARILVDKEAMRKALQYDREQYEKGYMAGRYYSVVHCSECKHRDTQDCMAADARYWPGDDDYCSWGERKEE